jgi:hypothetical protein
VLTGLRADLDRRLRRALVTRGAALDDQALDINLRKRRAGLLGEACGQVGALGIVPEVARCSNRTLRGSYAFNIDGTILAGPNRLLLRGLAMTQFDGRGHLSQVDFTTINGAPTGTDWRSGSGSYELNADCTGTMEIVQSDGSPTLRLRLVVADHGRTIHNIVEGSSTGATGTKVQ